MHEFAIARSIVEAVEREVAHRGLTQSVQVVRVVVGELSGVVPEALELAFGAAGAGTGLAEARLEIEVVPLILWCEACRREWHATEPYLLCDECGSAAVEVRSGRELRIASVDLEDGDSP